MFADKKICSRDPKAEEDMENNSGPQELFPVQYDVAIEKFKIYYFLTKYLYRKIIF